MYSNDVMAMLTAGKVLVLDGATGTNLQARGLESGTLSESWVLEHPEKILRLHQDFIQAGANVILTCSFNGNRYRLQHADLQEKADEINRKAVALAKQAADGKNVFVAGSLGPTGQMLAPYGTLDPADAEASYATQAASLSAAGVDLLVIETQFDIGEAVAAVKGVRSVSNLLLAVSFSYDRGSRTMMGVKPAQAAAEMEKLPVDILGINCGRSLEENLKALVDLRSATSLPIWFKPNAGMPHVDDDGKTVYDVSPQSMGEGVPVWVEAGASLIGGCCGTSPQHLAAIAVKVSGLNAA
jgi:5-methyltetrahydrofolate--homocysteine methyltransferase